MWTNLWIAWLITSSKLFNGAQQVELLLGHHAVLFHCGHQQVCGQQHIFDYQHYWGAQQHHQLGYI